MLSVTSGNCRPKYVATRHLLYFWFGKICVDFIKISNKPNTWLCAKTHTCNTKASDDYIETCVSEHDIIFPPCLAQIGNYSVPFLIYLLLFEGCFTLDISILLVSIESHGKLAVEIERFVSREMNNSQLIFFSNVVTWYTIHGGHTGSLTIFVRILRSSKNFLCKFIKRVIILSVVHTIIASVHPVLASLE